MKLFSARYTCRGTALGGLDHAGDGAHDTLELGDFDGETGKSDRAIETLGEGVRLLTPVFVTVPAAVSGMMRGLSQSY